MHRNVSGLDQLVRAAVHDQLKFVWDLNSQMRVAAQQQNQFAHAHQFHRRRGREANGVVQAGSTGADQVTVPKMAPIPAVTPIASAPQNVTRMVGFRMFAPPALAPIMPSRARNTKEPTETVGILQLDG